MTEKKGPTGQDDAQHKGKMQDARPNDGGRSGGQHGSGQADKSRPQGGQQNIEREKAEKGKGSPA